MTFSSIFYMLGNKDMGLWFVSSCVSFALYIGITFAVFQIFGTYPVSIDLLIKMLRGSHISSFLLLRNDVLMPSCPPPCVGLRETRILFISWGSVADKKSERSCLSRPRY